LHPCTVLFSRERSRWGTGLWRLECGPTVVATSHGDVPRGPAGVSGAARLDRAGQAVLVAHPEKETPNMADDRQLREFTCDPKYRKVLVTDAKTALGQSLVHCLAEAGAELIWAGYAE